LDEEVKGGEIMPDILHRVGIKATPKKVFEALSTIEAPSGITNIYMKEGLNYDRKFRNE
jgi:hypothetical protein